MASSCHEGSDKSETITGTDPKVALAGNPNCGKTTLFNILTKSRQRVGNWPGVTVDRKYGEYKDNQGLLNIVDLPGVYTLQPTPDADEKALDETLARDAIVSEGFDVIVNIVDATNLERNLYLTAQLIETGRPVIVALNMMDAAKKAGLHFNIKALSNKLGVPVVEIVAAKKQGIATLVTQVRQTIAQSNQTASQAPNQMPHTSEVAVAIEQVTQMLLADEEKQAELTTRKIDPRWVAMRLIEGDTSAQSMVGKSAAQKAKIIANKLEDQLGEDGDMVLAEGWYNFAHTASQAGIEKTNNSVETITDKVDRLVLHRIAGPVIFLAAIYLMFMATINLGGAFIDFFDMASAVIFVDATRVAFEWIGLPQWLIVVLSDGIGGGIQVVATFIPIITVLFLVLSFLEDSGYMVRAAFIMDRLMRAIGLPGKAFVPLIVGFGCNVPSIMAARTLERERDRLLTVLMAPFMSCGARLTVYVLFAAAFFPVGGQNIVFALYLLGIAAAIATGFLLKKTLLQGKSVPFLMELPPYHMPQVSNLVMHTWARLKSFIFDAGQMIVIVVTLLTVVNSLGTDGSFGNENTDKSMLSAIGRTITPVFKPIGIEQDNWPATVGIFTGIFAKEAVVGTLNALYSSIDAKPDTQSSDTEKFNFIGKMSAAFATIPQNLSGLSDFVLDPLGLSVVSADKAVVAADQGVANATFGAMVKRFDGKVGAFAYLLFILLYFPCVAAFSAMTREVGIRWATFAGAWTTWLAWFASVEFYQIATFAAHPMSSSIWIVSLLAIMVGFVFWLKLKSKQTITAYSAKGV